MMIKKAQDLPSAIEQHLLWNSGKRAAEPFRTSPACDTLTLVHFSCDTNIGNNKANSMDAVSHGMVGCHEC